MSEFEFDRCDRECEKIFEERDLNALITARAETMVRAEEGRLIRAKASAVQSARQRKSWRDACWLAAVMIGIFTGLCAMYINGQNTPMIIITAVLVIGFFVVYEVMAPRAAAYKGKRVRR